MSISIGSGTWNRKLQLVQDLKDALRELEMASEALTAPATAPGLGDALLRLDRARRRARATLDAEARS